MHDWLTGMRGGEKCLEVLCELFPQADLYTLLHVRGELSETIESMNIITSPLQHFPMSAQKYRYYLPTFPKLIECFDLNDYDLIISSSHCVAKGAMHHHHPYHISYIHAPMRYMWTLYHTYFEKPSVKLPVKWMARWVRPYLQYWDLQSNDRVHDILCNSRNIQRQIQNIYHREAKVVYPPVDMQSFQPGNQRENYYLMVGAFAPNKRVDLAIQVFNQLKLPLRIVGGGQEEAYCRSIAQSNIEFLGSVDDATIAKLYQNARAFVFPGEDDFGITPLEAQASGIPVIAYAKGGALETITDKTGIFFQRQTVADLQTAVETMEKRWHEFSPTDCHGQAQKFSRETYRLEMFQSIKAGYKNWLQQNARDQSRSQ